VAIDLNGDTEVSTRLLHDGQPVSQVVAGKRTNVEIKPHGPILVWPYCLIADSGPLSELAKRTFKYRPFVEHNDWSMDPIDAARLGLPDDMRTTLVDLTETYQHRPSGLASFGPTYPEPYAEQGGVVTTALQDALVQDYDGLLRIAPALPGGWDADATVYIQHRVKVDVQVRDGTPVTVAVEAGANGGIAVRNPWPGQEVRVVRVDAGRPQVVIGSTGAATFTVPARAGHDYLVERVARPRRCRTPGDRRPGRHLPAAWRRDDRSAPGDRPRLRGRHLAAATTAVPTAGVMPFGGCPVAAIRHGRLVAGSTRWT
jgi:hypothetical protein